MNTVIEQPIDGFTHDNKAGAEGQNTTKFTKSAIFCLVEHVN